MELSFTEGTFVSLEGELNYREVLDDFPNASIIRILTYNISKNQKQDRLLDLLKSTNADVQIITNVPSRMEQYYSTYSGERIRLNARRNIQIYISKLNPEQYAGVYSVFFNVHNHVKIIGTENIVYIGSANYSGESVNNIETGVIIKDKDFIKKLYEDFFDKVKDNSLSYYDESFSAFHLFIISLHTKLTDFYHKILTDLYTNYERTELVLVDTVLIDTSDLIDFYGILEDIEHVCDAADDTYDEVNKNYNEDLEILKSQFNSLSIEWLKETISEEGRLYRLVSFNVGKKAEELLQSEYAYDAYEETLDKYMKDSLDEAANIYYSLHAAFEEESQEFLQEVERILFALNVAKDFTIKWKASKINPNIDNT